MKNYAFYLYSTLYCLSFGFYLLGCGMKGMPQVPDEPPEIGQGYKEWQPAKEDLKEEIELQPVKKNKK